MQRPRTNAPVCFVSPAASAIELVKQPDYVKNFARQDDEEAVTTTRAHTKTAVEKRQRSPAFDLGELQERQAFRSSCHVALQSAMSKTKCLCHASLANPRPCLSPTAAGTQSTKPNRHERKAIKLVYPKPRRILTIHCVGILRKIPEAPRMRRITSKWYSRVPGTQVGDCSSRNGLR